MATWPYDAVHPMYLRGYMDGLAGQVAQRRTQRIADMGAIWYSDANPGLTAQAPLYNALAYLIGTREGKTEAVARTPAALEALMTPILVEVADARQKKYRAIYYPTYVNGIFGFDYISTAPIQTEGMPGYAATLGKKDQDGGIMTWQDFTAEMLRVFPLLPWEV